MRISGKLLLASSAGWLFAAPLWAQAPASPDESVIYQSVEAAPALTDDIVVTARRRSERLQDVPLAILAVSGDALGQLAVRNADDIAKVAPGLQTIPINGRRDALVFEIRGIATADILTPQDPGIAVYVNDVAQMRPQGLQGALFDIETIQILYGPQGTLFGRNSTGGAILITSKRPVLNELSGEARIMAGNYDRRDLFGVINIPVASGIALRVAGNRKKVDGFTRELTYGLGLDDENRWGVRGSLLIEPNDTIENLTIADYFKSNINGGGSVPVAFRDCGAIDPAYSALGYTQTTGNLACRFPDAPQLLLDQQARGSRAITFNVLPYSRQKAWGVGNTTNIHLRNDLLLKNIFGFRRLSQQAQVDLDGSTLPGVGTILVNRTKQVSEELQLQGTSFQGQLNWILGAYYFQETGFDSQATNAFSAAPAATILYRAHSRNVSRSLFVQGTYKPAGMSELAVTAGVRYTWDTRHIDWGHRRGTGQCQVFLDDARQQPLPDAICSLKDKTKFSNPTYNFSIDYHWTPQIMTYVAHRLGYRSGGFSPRSQTPATTAPFRPETIKDFEVGLKSSFDMGDMRFRFNIAAYIAKYKNLQRIKSILQSDNTPTTTIVNAAKATIKGGEAELTVTPFHGLDVVLNGSIADFNIDRFDGAFPNGQPITLYDVPGANSKYIWGARVQYTAATDMGELSVGGGYSWRSRNRNTPTSLPFYEPEGVNPSFGIANLNVRLSDIDGSGVYVGAFVDNVFDKTARVSALSVQQTLGYTSVLYTPPRMWGFEAGVKF